MKKLISILTYVDNPDQMKLLVESALKNADNPTQIQFVFYTSVQNKACQKMAHGLYKKYPPSLFDEDPKTATIKIFAGELSSPQVSAPEIVDALSSKTDGDLLLVHDIFSNDAYDFNKKSWDTEIITEQKILNSFQR